MPTTCTKNTAAAHSDYVFINIWAEPKGQAWSYQAAYDLVLRLRARTGIEFDPHWFRHSAATRWLRDGVSIEVVSKLLGHSSVTTTSAIIRASDGRGRAGGAGEGRLAHREGSVVVTGGWITQADRSRWQQRAAAELAAILAAHPGIPVLAWTVTASGGALSGQVLAPAAGRRGLFGQWQQAAGAGRGHRDPVRERDARLPARPRRPRRRHGQRHRDRLRRRGGQPVSRPEEPGKRGSRAASCFCGPAGEAAGRGAAGIPPGRPGVRCR